MHNNPNNLSKAKCRLFRINLEYDITHQLVLLLCYRSMKFRIELSMRCFEITYHHQNFLQITFSPIRYFSNLQNSWNSWMRRSPVSMLIIQSLIFMMMIAQNLSDDSVGYQDERWGHLKQYPGMPRHANKYQISRRDTKADRWCIITCWALDHPF